MKYFAFPLLTCIAVTAQAAPFATTSVGAIDGCTFPEIRNGERYAVTLVYDNGGISAANQDTAVSQR